MRHILVRLAIVCAVTLVTAACNYTTCRDKEAVVRDVMVAVPKNDIVAAMFGGRYAPPRNREMVSYAGRDKELFFYPEVTLGLEERADGTIVSMRTPMVDCQTGDRILRDRVNTVIDALGVPDRERRKIADAVIIDVRKNYHSLIRLPNYGF